MIAFLRVGLEGATKETLRDTRRFCIDFLSTFFWIADFEEIGNREGA